MAGLQYLWLFEDMPLAGDLFGVPFIATYLVPLVPLAMGLRFRVLDWEAWRALIGGVGLWLLALVVPLVLLGGGLLGYWLAGGEVDPDWRWITLGWSALFDFPLMWVVCLPMLVGVEGAMRLLPGLALESVAAGNVAAGRRHGDGGETPPVHSQVTPPVHSQVPPSVHLQTPPVHLQTPPPRFWMSIITALISAGSQVPLLLHLADAHTPLFAGATALLMVGCGAFAYRIQSRGALLPATAAVLMTVTAATLIVGCNVPDLLHAYIGFDVDAVAPLVSKKSPFFAGIPAAAGALLLVVSFLVSPRPRPPLAAQD
jgi:hypothetical protein